VVTKRLTSGDIVLTFQGAAEAIPIGTWIQDVFGAGAMLSRREVAMIARGIPAVHLRAAQNVAALTEDLAEVNTKHITSAGLSELGGISISGIRIRLVGEC
jgi:hypothetical protein